MEHCAHILTNTDTSFQQHTISSPYPHITYSLKILIKNRIALLDNTTVFYNVRC